MIITLEDALTTGRGQERPFNCPVHGDDNASASVNVNLGWWYCFACGAKGTIDGFVPDPTMVLKMLEESLAPPRVFAESWLDVFDAHHVSEYWSSRFDHSIAHLYRCGTDPVTGEPTYPIRSLYGDVLGVVRRTDGKPKYRYPYNVSTSRNLFLSISLVRRVNVLVLVEGAPDVMALHQAGLPEGWRAAGCFGAGVHLPQVDLIETLSPAVVVVAFNNDKAGIPATERSQQLLSQKLPAVSHRWDNVEVSDFGEMEVAQRIPALRQTIKENDLEMVL